MPTPGLTASITLSPDRQSPRRAREFVVAILGRWGAEGMIFRVALAVSELVTNAVVHAGTPVELTVRRARGAVRIEVADDSPALPHRLDVPPDALSGRGLALVDSLSRAWGVEHDAHDGKVVWCEIDRGDEVMAGAGAQPPSL